eukprot:GHVP01003664.1.p1 GENE.GHVP01003664.1~~GHVP01003664.1.p1  ORF type:complete len:270 (-),score=52.06 GHVP01003664.1:874-1683(-)
MCGNNELNVRNNKFEFQNNEESRFFLFCHFFSLLYFSLFLSNMKSGKKPVLLAAVKTCVNSIIPTTDSLEFNEGIRVNQSAYSADSAILLFGGESPDSKSDSQFSAEDEVFDPELKTISPEDWPNLGNCTISLDHGKNKVRIDQLVHIDNDIEDDMISSCHAFQSLDDLSIDLKDYKKGLIQLYGGNSEDSIETVLSNISGLSLFVLAQDENLEWARWGGLEETESYVLNEASSASVLWQNCTSFRTPRFPAQTAQSLRIFMAQNALLY